MKHLNDNLWQDTIQIINYLKERILIGLSIGIVTVGLTILLKKVGWEYTLDLNAVVLIAVTVFILYIAKDAYKILELRNRMEKADVIYKDIIDGHTELPYSYSFFMNELILNDDFKNGIAMLNINDRKYKSILEGCSINLKKSYYASFTTPYTIERIFKLKPGDNNIVDVSEIIDFFNKINKKLSKIQTRKRVFIFEKNKFIADIQNVKKKVDCMNLINLFRAQIGYELFFIDKTKLKQDASLYSEFESLLEADFAVFDEALAFRRTDKQELCFYYINDNKLTTIFEKIYEIKTFENNPGVFYPLTKTKELIESKDFNNNVGNVNKLIEKLKEDFEIP